MSFEKYLWIDTDNRKLVKGFRDPSEESTIKFTQGDVVPLRVVLLKSNPGNPGTPYSNIEVTTETLRVAMGRIDQSVTSGTFTLTYGADTTAALDYDISVADLSTALNGLASITSAGGVTVTGSDGGPWTVTFDSVGARTAISGDLTNIVPISDLAIFTKTEGDGSTAEVQILKLKESPIALQESFSTLSAPSITVTETIAGGTGINEQQKVKIDKECRGGNFVLGFGADQATFEYGVSAADMKTGLEAMSTLAAGDTSVIKISDLEYDITFIGTKAATNVALIVADDSGLLGFEGFSANFDLSSYAVEELLNLTEEDAELFFEVELYLSGARTTLLRLDNCTIENDLIDEAVAAPPSNGTDWPALLATKLENVVEDTTPQLGGDLDLNGNSIDFPTTANVSDCLDEDNMASDSATALATQQSIKAYVDTQVAGVGGMDDLIDDTTPQLGGNLDAQNKNINTLLGLGFKTSTTLTISSGAVTQTQMIHAIGNESAAATDDLDSIVPATGQTELLLTMSASGQVPTIKHATGTNTFLLPDDTDIEMKMNTIYHFHHDGTNWKLVGSSASGGSGGGKVKQVVSTQDNTYASTTTAIPDDNTIPQQTEGGSCGLDTSITPTSGSNDLIIMVSGWVNGAGYGAAIALFKDSDADAIAAQQFYVSTGGEAFCLVFKVSASTTSARTYKARFGQTGGTCYWLGSGGAKLGSARSGNMTIWEVEP
jgi:hypothetical protein